MRVLEGSNRVRNGLMGILIVILVIGVGQSFASVPMLFATPTYYAEFSDTGGLNNGDKVRIAGVDVGTVRSMDIDGDKVVIGYALGGTQIGKESRAAIRTARHHRVDQHRPPPTVLVEAYHDCTLLQVFNRGEEVARERWSKGGERRGERGQGRGGEGRRGNV